MAIDEATLPKKGDRVRFQRKTVPGIAACQGVGTVEYQWWAEDEIALAIVTDDGRNVNMIPALGDEVALV